MTISSTHNKHVYNADGVNRVWDYTFPIIDASDVEIWVTDLDQVRTLITSDYTIDINLQKVTYPTIISGLPLLVTGEKLTLRRKVPLTQEVDLDNQGPLPSTTLEEEYDKLTLITQQHAEELRRCLKYHIDEDPTLEQTENFRDEILDYVNDAQASADAAAASALESANSASDSAVSAAAALESENNAEQAYQDAVDAIQDFVDHFYDKYEQPTGIVNGVNTQFNISLVPVNDIVKVFLDGLLVPEDEWSFSFPTITFDTPPAIGQKVRVTYITHGETANPSVPGASYLPEYRLLTGGEVAAKQLTLTNTPLVGSQVICDMIGGSSQAYAVDFIVVGNVVYWNGLGLDGEVMIGTILRFQYFY